MTAPQVRLHPDGRAVVRLDSWSDNGGWLAVGVDDGNLNVERFTDEQVPNWPEYAPPDQTA